MSVDEWVDVVDADDRVVGRATRRQMRAENLRHRCVWIVVQDSGGRLFIHRRTESKDVYPSYWDVTVGGVVSAGEAYSVAAVRELAEELAVAANFIAAPMHVRFEDDATAAVGRAYLSRFDGTPVLQVSEVACGEWATPERLAFLLRRERFCPDGLVALRALCEGEEEQRSALALVASSVAWAHRSN